MSAHGTSRATDPAVRESAEAETGENPARHAALQPPDERDRRPVAARHWGPVTALARLLAAWRVSPDAISAASMGCAIVAGVLLGITPRIHAVEPGMVRLAFAAAAALVLLRGLCNVLDGMVAIATGKASAVGELWNEVPDRVSDCAMLVGLGYALGGWPVLGWASALSAVMTAYVRAQCRAAGAPQDFGGPMAKPTRLMLVALCAAAMALLPEAWTTDWWSIVNPWSTSADKPESMAAGHGLPAATLLVVAVGSLVTAARRLLRAGLHLSRTPSRWGGR